MEKSISPIQKVASLLIAVALVAVLWLSSLRSYLLFHSLAEGFSILIAVSIFMLAWNSRRFMDNNYLLFLGIAYLFVAVLDLFHSLCYRGMGIFFVDEGNAATQLWIAARYMQALSLLLAPLFIRRRLKPPAVVASYATAVALVLAFIIWRPLFPDCFIAGSGLTPFKKASEYVISAILVGSIIMLYRNRRSFHPLVFRWVVWSVGLTILSELAFTFYVSVYGLSNLVGHFLKIFAFCLIYKAIIETGLSRPYDLLFRNLKQSEEALKKSEERYRGLVELSPDAVFVNRNERVIFVNQAAVRAFGAAQAAEILGRSPYELFHSDYHHVMRELGRLLQKGEMIPLTDGKIVRLDGSIRSVEVAASPFLDVEGPGVQVVFRDVTERREAEVELARQREWLRVTLTSIGDAVIAADRAGKVTFINPAAEELTGWSLSEAFGHGVQGVFRIIHEKTGDPSEDIVEEVFREGKIISLANHTALVSREGRVIPIEDSAAPIKDESGAIIGAVIVFHDVTSKRKAQQELRESEDRLRVAVESAELGTWDFDPLTGDMKSSERCNAIFGVPGASRVDYQLFLDLLHPDDRDRVDEEVRCALNPSGNGSFGTEYRLRRPDGEERWVVAAGRVYFGSINGKENALRFLGTVLDITGRKEAEEAMKRARDDLEKQVKERTTELRRAYDSLRAEIEERKGVEDRLRQAQKMEAIGTLAGGIAHDFNNILAGIIGFTEMAIDDTSSASPVHRRLSLVLRSAMRGRDLVRQILAFSRQTEQERKSVELSDIVEEALKLLRPAFPSTIEIKKRFMSGGDRIFADPVQIHQVFMNLCTNGAHAMRDKGGVLEVSIEELDISGDEPSPYPGMKPGPYIRLSVRDSGCGISPENRDKIFDPFFTTKAPGEGTGLGLSVVHGIVKSHGGQVGVYSEPGRGSVFHVYLPKEAGVSPGEPCRASQLQGGKESILFVDDEEILVEMNSGRLSKLGYEVVGCTSSAEALEIFQREPGRFDLVITDYTMPGMTGMDLSEAMLTIRPEIPIILCSGLNETISAEKVRQSGLKAFIGKTANKREFAKIIRKVLDK
ncbi:MAG TPA: MASE3 domain-containing protein [Syntrophorhabdaceae bacterium]|jgi:PAS domain S-box-containing protein